MNPRSIEQRRAAHALRVVRAIRDGDRKFHSSYRSYVSELPAAILTNGLGQAAATLLAQAKEPRDAHRLLFDHLEAWLCGGDEESPYAKGDLLEALVENDQRTYLRAQAEALAYLEWVKKFAVAFLAKEKENAGGTG